MYWIIVLSIDNSTTKEKKKKASTLNSDEQTLLQRSHNALVLMYVSKSKTALARHGAWKTFF